MTLPDIVALTVTMLWPIIPLWWIPIHGVNNLARKIGIFMYPVVFSLWVVCASVIYANKAVLLSLSIDFPLPMRIAGALFFLTGIFIQMWTLKALSTRVITGVPEFIDGEKTQLAVQGPFSKVRHPTYASHTLMLIGLCLVTGSIVIGCVAFVDFLTTTIIIIPMEEKELLQRFGDEYRVYMAQTPRLFPRMRRSA